MEDVSDLTLNDSKPAATITFATMNPKYQKKNPETAPSEREMMA
jgi:hypothetical protein